jgi:hypothetical protein
MRKRIREADNGEIQSKTKNTFIPWIVDFQIDNEME